MFSLVLVYMYFFKKKTNAIMIGLKTSLSTNYRDLHYDESNCLSLSPGDPSATHLCVSSAAISPCNERSVLSLWS